MLGWSRGVHGYIGAKPRGPAMWGREWCGLVSTGEEPGSRLENSLEAACLLTCLSTAKGSGKRRRFSPCLDATATKDGCTISLNQGTCQAKGSRPCRQKQDGTARTTSGGTMACCSRPTTHQVIAANQWSLTPAGAPNNKPNTRPPAYPARVFSLLFGPPAQNMDAPTVSLARSPTWLAIAWPRLGRRDRYH